MARVTHVKSAQQRYETVPVIDPATGKPKQTPVMKKVREYDDDGNVIGYTEKQKTTKRGALVFMTVTKQDRTKPKPLYTCGACQKPIEIGTPYKHISPKSGPYGGRKMTRHEDCPTWQVWDYSYSLSAQLMRIAYEFNNEIDSVETPEDVTSALESAAGEIRELAAEKESGADNIEEGFGHETSMSEELRGIAEALEGWADEIEQVDVPDLPEPEDENCPECGGTGVEDLEEAEDADGNEITPDDCPACDGTGEFTPDEPSEQQMDDWRDEVRDAVSIVDESPV